MAQALDFARLNFKQLFHGNVKRRTFSQKKYIFCCYCSHSFYSPVLQIPGFRAKIGRAFQCLRLFSSLCVWNNLPFCILFFFVPVAPKIEPFSFRKDLEKGGRTRISCTAIKGDLPIRYNIWSPHIRSEDINFRVFWLTFFNSRFRWFFNGRELSKGRSDGVSFSGLDDFSSSISFPVLSTGLSGEYACEASNAAARVRHASVLVVNGEQIRVAKQSVNKFPQG